MFHHTLLLRGKASLFMSTPLTLTYRMKTTTRKPKNSVLQFLQDEAKKKDQANGKKFVTNFYNLKNPIKLFFDSMYGSTKGLPPHFQRKIKKRLLMIITKTDEVADRYRASSLVLSSLRSAFLSPAADNVSIFTHQDQQRSTYTPYWKLQLPAMGQQIFTKQLLLDNIYTSSGQWFFFPFIKTTFLFINNVCYCKHWFQYISIAVLNWYVHKKLTLNKLLSSFLAVSPSDN